MNGTARQGQTEYNLTKERVDVRRDGIEISIEYFCIDARWMWEYRNLRLNGGQERGRSTSVIGSSLYMIYWHRGGNFRGCFESAMYKEMEMRGFECTLTFISGVFWKKSETEALNSGWTACHLLDSVTCGLCWIFSFEILLSVSWLCKFWHQNSTTLC